MKIINSFQSCKLQNSKNFESIQKCQKPPVKDWWHVNATLRVVFDHCQNSTHYLNHPSKMSGILKFKFLMPKEVSIK